jgi:outer membrane cobalamin receptor
MKAGVFAAIAVAAMTGATIAQAAQGDADTLRSLEEIEVRDRTEIDKLKQSALSISIIDGKDLVGRSVSISDALDRVAGLKVRNAGGIGGERRISIRGLGGKRVRIFIDEAPISALDGLFGLDDLPVQLIERIEIYKGVVPAKFGADVLGGAINIVTVSRVFSYADFTYKLSSYNTHQPMLLSKYCRPNGFYVGLGGLLNYSDNDYPMNVNAINKWNLPGLDAVIREHDRYRMNLLGMSIGKWDGFFDDIGVELVYFGNYKEIQGIAYPIKHAHTFANTGFIAPYIEKSDLFVPGLDLDMHAAVLVTLSSFIDTASSFYSRWGGEPKPAVGRGETNVYAKHNSRDTLIVAQTSMNLEYTLNEHNRIDLNNLLQVTDFTPYDAIDISGSHVSIAAYPALIINDVVNLGHDLKLFDDRLNNYLSAKLFMQNVSVDISRVNSNENIMGKITMDQSSARKFGFGDALSFKPAPQVTLYGSFQHGVRLPDRSELFGDGVGVTQNLELKSETSQNGAAGFHLLVKRDERFLPRFEFELSGFTRVTNNLIKLEPGLLQALYKNIDKVRALGFEADVKTDLFPWLYLTSNVTFQDMRYLESETEPFKVGKRLANEPFLFGNAGVELSRKNLFLKNSIAKLFWEASFTYEYYDKVQVVDSPKDIIPGHFLQNAGVQYSWNEALDVGLEVHNLADAVAYEIHRQPIPGRTLHLILKYFLRPKQS